MLCDSWSLLSKVHFFLIFLAFSSYVFTTLTVSIHVYISFSTFLSLSSIFFVWPLFRFVCIDWHMENIVAWFHHTPIFIPLYLYPFGLPFGCLHSFDTWNSISVQLFEWKKIWSYHVFYQWSSLLGSVLQYIIMSFYNNYFYYNSKEHFYVTFLTDWTTHWNLFFRISINFCNKYSVPMLEIRIIWFSHMWIPRDIFFSKNEGQFYVSFLMDWIHWNLVYVDLTIFVTTILHRC